MMRACLNVLDQGDLFRSLAQRDKELFPEGQELDGLLLIHVHTGVRPHCIDQGLLPGQNFLRPLKVFLFLFVVEKIEVFMKSNFLNFLAFR
jgi:hypothetical protein